LVKKRSYAEVAVQYRVSKTLIGRLKKRHQGQGDYIEQLETKEAEIKTKLQATVAEVQKFVDQGRHLWRTGLIVEAVQAHHGIKVRSHYVSGVLHVHFGMRYKKVKRTAFLANSQRSLVVRSLFARKALQLLKDGCRLVNLDQSFLKESDFRQRKWRYRGQPNSACKTTVEPRISLSGAIDTDGHVWISLSQSNTDEDTFCLFMQELVQDMAKERPDFREDTYFMFDTAAYQVSAIARNFLGNLGLKIIICGPYGYMMSPIEIFWASQKSTNLNY
jgi:transposase